MPTSPDAVRRRRRATQQTPASSGQATVTGETARRLLRHCYQAGGKHAAPWPLCTKHQSANATPRLARQRERDTPAADLSPLPISSSRSTCVPRSLLSPCPSRRAPSQWRRTAGRIGWTRLRFLGRPHKSLTEAKSGRDGRAMAVETFRALSPCHSMARPHRKVAKGRKTSAGSSSSCAAARV